MSSVDLDFSISVSRSLNPDAALIYAFPCPAYRSWVRGLSVLKQILINTTIGTNTQVTGNPTSQEFTRNRRVGQRECGPHESFSLVSPYRSVSKPRGDSPPHNGKRNPVPRRERNSEPALLSVGGWHA